MGISGIGESCGTSPEILACSDTFWRNVDTRTILVKRAQAESGAILRDPIRRRVPVRARK
jgi:hypothetical protein